MARLMYKEDGKWGSIESIEKVASGSLVGMPGLDPDEVKSQIESLIDEEDEPSSNTAVSPEDWKLKQSPSKYLANSPKGPQAKLAQQLVDAGLGDITVEDMEEDED